MEQDYVYVPVDTRDESSGRVHRRVSERDPGTGEHRRFLVDERCQTDQSGAFVVLVHEQFGAIAADAPAALCRFCYGERAVPAGL